jgi:hypothetical protein
VSRTSFFCTDTLGVRNAWSLRALQKHIIKVTMSIVCYEGGSKEQVKRSEVYGKWLERHGIEGKAPCYVGSCGEVGEKRIVVRG